MPAIVGAAVVQRDAVELVVIVEVIPLRSILRLPSSLPEVIWEVSQVGGEGLLLVGGEFIPCHVLGRARLVSAVTLLEVWPESH